MLTISEEIRAEKEGRMKSCAGRCFLQAAIHRGDTLTVPLAAPQQSRHVGSVLQRKTRAHAAVTFLLHHLCCLPSFLSPLTPACGHCSLLSLSLLSPVLLSPHLPEPSLAHASWDGSDGSRGWQVTWVGPGTSRVQPQTQQLVGPGTAPGWTGLGKVITVQGNPCSWLFLGCSGRALQAKPKEILQLISLTG